MLPDPALAQEVVWIGGGGVMVQRREGRLLALGEGGSRERKEHDLWFMELSGRRVWLNRREVRELLKEVTVYCCGVAGEMSLARSLAILEKCVSGREAQAARLKMLLKFAQINGRSDGSPLKALGPLEGMGNGMDQRVERDSWDAL
jgi:hypothetical protein